MTATGIAAIGGTSLIAGCDTVGDTNPGESGAEGPITEATAYRLLANSIDVVSTPWRRTAIDRANQIHESIVDELRSLLSKWRGELKAIRGIVSSTTTALEALSIGQQSFDIELIRARWKFTGSDLESVKSGLQSAGVQYDSQRPIYPLFRSLQQGARSVASSPTDERKSALAQRGERVRTLLTVYYLPQFRAAAVSGPFVELLAESLQFLERVANEVRR